MFDQSKIKKILFCYLYSDQTGLNRLETGSTGGKGFFRERSVPNATDLTFVTKWEKMCYKSLDHGVVHVIAVIQKNPD